MTIDRSVDVGNRRLMPLYVALTLVLLGVAAYEFILLIGIIGDQQALGVDQVYYRDVGRRWLETGVYYTDRQLAGPYVQTTLVDNLYPPHALYLFVPFVFLPAILWWLVPLGLVVYALWELRPRPWVWPILALILALPKTGVVVLYGNTDLWVLGLVAGAVLWGWPGVLLSFKPSLGFLGLIGITRRSWWVAAAVLAILSLPMIPLWLDWPTVVRNSQVSAEYSLANIPLMILPVVAWLGSSRRGRPRLPAPVAALVGRVPVDESRR